MGTPSRVLHNRNPSNGKRQTVVIASHCHCHCHGHRHGMTTRPHHHPRHNWSRIRDAASGPTSSGVLLVRRRSRLRLAASLCALVSRRRSRWRFGASRSAGARVREGRPRRASVGAGTREGTSAVTVCGGVRGGVRGARPWGGWARHFLFHCHSHSLISLKQFCLPLAPATGTLRRLFHQRSAWTSLRTPAPHARVVARGGAGSLRGNPSGQGEAPRR